MLNVNELKAAMARKGMTQQKVANALGVSTKALFNKIKKGVFKSDEIEQLIMLLDIKDPMAVFFGSIKNTSVKK